MNWADMEDDTEILSSDEEMKNQSSSQMNESVTDEMKVVEETKTCSKDEYLVINHTNTTKIKTKGMNALIHSIHKSLENTIKGVSDKYKNIYQYVTGRIKTPFNQFTKMIRIDYHYHQRMIKIYRNYTILTLQQFKNIYSRIIEDMTE